MSENTGMLLTREHYDLMAQFERTFRGRFDKEAKELWPRGIIYQDGAVNELFKAYRHGYAFAVSDYRSDLQNLEASRDGYRRDATTLHEALSGVVRILEAFSYTTQLGKGQRERLEAAKAALSRTNVGSAGEGGKNG